MEIGTALPDIRIKGLARGDDTAEFQIHRFFLLNLYRGYQA